MFFYNYPEYAPTVPAADRAFGRKLERVAEITTMLILVAIGSFL